LNSLHWVMRASLLKTLAHKHKSTVAKMIRRFTAKVSTPFGPRTCLETRVPREGKEPLIARFGGIPLRTNLTASFEDLLLTRRGESGTELLRRLLADACEACGSTDNVEVGCDRRLM
jgi:Type II intron maturase